LEKVAGYVDVVGTNNGTRTLTEIFSKVPNFGKVAGFVMELLPFSQPVKKLPHSWKTPHTFSKTQGVHAAQFFLSTARQRRT
jgi:hypothetical protein